MGSEQPLSPREALRLLYEVASRSMMYPGQIMPFQRPFHALYEAVDWQLSRAEDSERRLMKCEIHNSALQAELEQLKSKEQQQ